MQQSEFISAESGGFEIDASEEVDLQHDAVEGSVAPVEPVSSDKESVTSGSAEKSGVASGEDSSERLSQVVAVLEALRVEVVATNDRAVARERVIDRLHEENDRLRAGERLMALRPILVDLQRLRNDLLRQAVSLPEGMSAVQMAELLQSFAFSAEQALERCGVEVIRPEPGAPFDIRRHRAAGSVPAPSPDLDGSIAEVLGDGYLDTTEDRALSTATVRVHRWVPVQETEPDVDVSSAGTAAAQTGSASY